MADDVNPALIVLGHEQLRDILVVGYDGSASKWGRIYRTLFNNGYRSPVDKNGFPTRRTQEAGHG